MSCTYVISKFRNKICSFRIDEKGRTQEICMDSPDDGRLRTGDVLIGRVSRVLWNIKGAFLDLGEGRTGYLALEDLKTPLYTHKGESERLSQGDELLVQVKREAIKSKAPSVTAVISLHGQWTVLERGEPSISISRKIAGRRREELRQLLSDAVNQAETPAGYGHRSVLLRTKAGEACSDAILKELDVLERRLRQIEECAPFRPVGSMLYRPAPPWMERLLHLPSGEPVRIVTDVSGMHAMLTEFLREHMPDAPLLPELYQDESFPIDKLYSFRHRLDEALEEKVFLKSGAFLVIQPTEALISIDVNSGQNTPGRHTADTEAFFLKINMEAAREIARQMRLRNMSGIIIVDFINLKEQSSRSALLTFLDQLLKEDPVQSVLVDMTALGLAEITRKKTGPPLWETINPS